MKKLEQKEFLKEVIKDLKRRAKGNKVIAKEEIKAVKKLRKDLKEHKI